jgi:hypothetical protein
MNEMKPRRANPYRTVDGQWWWFDEDGTPVGPYQTQVAAVRGLLKWIDGQRPWWKKLLGVP